MKSKLILIVLAILMANQSVFSQEINILAKSVPVTKGKITYRSGQSLKFRYLTNTDSLITFRDNNGLEKKEKLSDIYKITKSGTYAGYGAALGFLCGALASLEVEAEYQKDIANGYIEKSGGRFPIYLGVTAFTTAVGGLVGLIFKKEKTLYIDLAHVSIYPSISLPVSNNKYSLLTIRCTF